MVIWIVDGFQLESISDASFTLRSRVLPFTLSLFPIKTNDDYSASSIFLPVWNARLLLLIAKSNPYKIFVRKIVFTRRE